MTRKILFFTYALGGGGAERVLLTLIRHLDRDKFEPILVLVKEKIAYKQDIPSDLKIIYLKKITWLDNFRLTSALVRVIREEQPALVFSSLGYTNIIALLAHRYGRATIPLVISTHVDLMRELKEERKPLLWTLLTRYYYPKATMIHCVSKNVGTGLMDNFKITPEKIRVIYNPYNIQRILLLAQERVDHPWFAQNIPVLLACGRLAEVKNYPLLLRTLRRLLGKTMVRMVILGDGEKRSQLEGYAREIGVSSYVEFLGFEANPFKYMAKATALVLSSRSETFSNVIIEAMACGLPVISTQCQGPEEIITPGVNGLLVPLGREEELAQAIQRVLENEPLRRQLSQAGRKRSQDFDVSTIMPQYEELFQNLSSGAFPCR